MSEQTLEQTKVFEEALESSAHEISEDMYGWDFATMMEELRRTIAEKAAKKGDNFRAVRSFSRHYLQMSGERYNEVRSWLDGRSTMSADNIRLVLRVLNQIRNGSLDITLPESSSKEPHENGAPKNVAVQKETSGVIRKIIDHTVGSLYSLVGLIAEARVQPTDVFGSDREQVRASMQKVCDHFGISVKFSESKSTHFESMTPEDLAEIGFGTTSKGRRR